MDKFIPGSPCPYHGSYTKNIVARYKDQIANAGGGAGVGAGAGCGPGPAAEFQAQAREMEPIWDIVSGLAKALTEARDQISTLMKHQHQPQARNGGGGSGHPDRSPSPGSRTPHNHYTHSRCPPKLPVHRDLSNGSRNNIHRSHANSFYAFGRNTEYKELMHHNAGGRMHPPHRYCGEGWRTKTPADPTQTRRPAWR